MESKRIAVNKDLQTITACMDEAESFVTGLPLDKKSILRMRLLSEEILEMLKSMLGEFSGQFWLESKEGECRICIEGEAEINISKERDLMSVSKDGKNISVKGFSMKLSQFIRHHKEFIKEALDVGAEYGGMDYMYLGAMHHNVMGNEVVWSLNNYRACLDAEENQDEQLEENKDELEKSIVANLADDVQVGVFGDTIKMTVIKKV